VTSKVRCIKREQKIDEAEIIKLKRAMYIETCHNVDVLTEANKSAKTLRKKLQDDQISKFTHDEKMLEMQLICEKYIYECKKDKRESQEELVKTLLEANNVRI
jgi:hypothetical protein